MKLATYRLTPDAPGTPPDVPPGASWARFGDEVLLVSDEARWDASAERPGRGALRECRASVEREHLHVVVQNGRLFEQEHPDVPVILNRGRILLVELERERARRLAEGNETCYGVVPLRDNQVVFDSRHPAAERGTPIAWIQELVAKLAGSTLEADLAHLVSFPTRHLTSAHFANAAAWGQRPLRRGHHRPHRLRFCAGDLAHERRVRGPHGRPGTATEYLLESTGLGSGRLPAKRPGCQQPGLLAVGA